LTASRWTPWAGFGFVVLCVAGAALMLAKMPDPEDSNSRIIDFYNDSTAHYLAILGYYFWSIANVLLLWFLIDLHKTLRRAEGGDGNVATFGFAAGILMIALLLISAATFVTVGGAIEIGGAETITDPEWMRACSRSSASA
jgi:hypothetical protein